MIIQNMPLIYAHGLRPDVSEEEAERIFAQAAQAAYDEVLAHCRLLRGQEIHNRQMNLQREAEQRRNAEATTAWRAREIEASRLRTEALRQAEAMPSQKKTRLWNE